MGHPARGDFLRGGSRSVRNVKELGGSCCGRGTSGEGGWEPQQVVMLKNREMWGEARFGGTFGVEVRLPARGDMRILM